MTVREPEGAASTWGAEADSPDLGSPADEPVTARMVDRFVGRVVDLRELTAVVDAARQGRGRLVLVSGEPGIGKTRLVEEVGRFATAGDLRVVWGRSWQGGGAPAFWPWAEVLRELPDADHPAAPQAEPGRPAGAVARLVEGVVHASASPARDVDEERFAVFDAVVAFLRAAAQERPLLLALDDLQWADPSSLLLLQFVARHLHDSRVAVVGLFRDTEMGAAHPLARVVSELASSCTRITLRGLDLDEVVVLLGPVVGDASDRELAWALQRRTGGNPFFLREVLRSLTRRHATDRLWLADGEVLPESVREAVRARVDHLSEAARELLAAAAVVGRAFAARLLATVVGEDEERVLDLVAQQLRAGLVTRAQPPSEGWCFAHDLVREALYDDLPAAQRRAWHHAVGVALEAQYRDDPEPHLAELAHHFTHGLPTDTDKAAGYSARAGQRALVQMAYEAAVAHFRRALDLLERGSQSSQRVSVLLGLAEAHRRAGDTDDARAVFADAAAAARRMGDGGGLAQAALGYGALWGEWSTSDRGGANRGVLTLLEEALAALDPLDSPLRARVLARLARARYFGHDTRQADSVSLAAAQMAQRLGDAATSAEVLAARHDALWVPGDPTPRLVVAAELLDAARDSGAEEMVLQAHAVRFTALLERGDGVDADAELDAYEWLADTLGQPRYRWYATSRRAVRMIMAGRFDEGERLAREALTLGRRAHEPEAEPVFFDARRMLGRHRGFDDDDLAAQRRYASRYPELAIFRVSAAHIAGELGRAEEAAVLLDGVVGDLEQLPRDWLWCSTMCLLGETVAGLNEHTAAEQLLELLTPYAGLHAVEGGASAYNGAVAHVLGLLAASLHRLDDAVAHLERARTMHAQVGARPWQAHTDGELARVLRRRGGPGGDRQARHLLAAADMVAEELGMPVLADRVASTEPAGGLSPAGAETNVFRRDGDVWTLAYGGQTVQLRHVKGLADLAELLGRPGHELHVLELMTGGRPPATTHTACNEPELRTGHRSDAVLDAPAIAAYRARLEALEADIAEADRHHDRERAARAREEHHFIAAELAAGLGLGGRPRSFPDAAERARKAAGNRIRRALRRIEHHHPELAAHLHASLHLGTFCAYRPVEPTRWQQ